MLSHNHGGNAPQVDKGSFTAENRHLHVACALIEREGLLLAAQRSAAMNLPLKWEFPGGKIEAGETPAACLHRELREELAVSVVVGSALRPHTHHYPDFTVTLYPFLCRLASSEIVLREHAAIQWLTPDELPILEWAAADLPVVADYLAGRLRERAPARDDSQV